MVPAIAAVPAFPVFPVLRRWWKAGPWAALRAAPLPQHGHPQAALLLAAMVWNARTLVKSIGRGLHILKVS